MAFAKGVVRTVVIVALAGGAAAVVAERVSPGSARALLGQVRHGIRGAIERTVDDPVELRAQLTRLESQYPERIAQVRSDLTEVDRHVADLERELAISARVVELTSADLSSLDEGLERAREAEASSPHAVVRISFENRRMDVGSAYTRRTQIAQTNEAYGAKAEQINVELGFLSQQRDQLTELLAQLETERAQFQAQIVQLDAQIESIARNERLISIMEDRQRRIDDLSRHEVHSLEQFQRRVETMREAQRARLGDLARERESVNYEDVARWELERSGEIKTIEVAPPAPQPAAEERVIEAKPAGPTGGRVAGRMF